MRYFMFLACTLSLAYAQQLSSPRPNDSTLVPPVRPFRLPPRTGIETQMDVSLDQALAMALANNKDIESSRIDRLESDYSLTAALGAFDPQLNVTSYWEQQITPIASSLGGSATGSLLNKTWQADPGITQPLPWYGGTFKTDLSSVDASSNNTFLSLNPQYETALNFSYTQPLWRNLLYDSNRHQIDVAKKNRSLTDAQFRQRVMAVVLQTEQAYWELSYAYNNLQVQLDAVRIGIQQDESNRRQEQQGLLAPIDVVAAQTQLANFEVGAYAAQSALTASENALKELVLPDRTDATWSSALTPTTPEDVPDAAHSAVRCNRGGDSESPGNRRSENQQRDQPKGCSLLSRSDQTASQLDRSLHARGFGRSSASARPQSVYRRLRSAHHSTE